MQSVYALNNLPFWSEEAIEQRAFLAQRFHSRLEAKVRERNRAWLFERIEAPMLIPRELLNLEYSDQRNSVRRRFTDYFPNRGVNSGITVSVNVVRFRSSSTAFIPTLAGPSTSSRRVSPMNSRASG